VIGKVTFGWRYGVELEVAKRGNPQRVGEALEHIRVEAGGQLYPRDVVTAARKTENPLHHFFEWDDNRAALRYRLDQATKIIAAVAVLVPDADEPLQRAYVAFDKADPSKGYAPPAAVAVRDVTLSAPVVPRSRADAAVNELLRWCTRYESAPDLRELVATVRAALEEVHSAG
jgi:hypothetical protein